MCSPIDHMHLTWSGGQRIHAALVELAFFNTAITWVYGNEDTDVSYPCTFCRIFVNHIECYILRRHGRNRYRYTSQSLLIIFNLPRKTALPCLSACVVVRVGELRSTAHNMTISISSNGYDTPKRTLKLPDSARKLHETSQEFSIGGINSLPLYLSSGKGSHLRVSCSSTHISSERLTTCAL